MTRIRPFRALRYDVAKVSLAKVIVPPYDVIAAADREGFYARDPHNAIRLELTRRVEDEARTDYADVRGTLEDVDALGRAGARCAAGLLRAAPVLPAGPTARPTCATASSACSTSRTTPAAACAPTSARSRAPRRTV